MKKIILLFSFVSICLSISAQSIYQELQPVSLQDLQMTTYDKDKDAGAVVLYDYGETYFLPSTNGFEVMFKRTTRIKILNESGLDWAEIEVPIYAEEGREEVFSKLKGTTYNMENGRIVKAELNTDQVYDEKYNQFWDFKKFAMPNVKKGSVIEYSYLTSSKSFYNFKDWEFQREIPVIHSEYQAKLTPFYTYKWILQGANSFYANKSQKATGLDNSILGVKYKEMTYNYVMKDVPAFHDADFITTKDDYIIKMDWQLIKYSDLRGIEHEIMSTWEKIVKEYNSDETFGKFIGKVAKKAPKLIDVPKISQLSDREKVTYVLDFVKENYEWNGIQNEISSQSLNDLMKKKSGLSGDINLLAAGLLTAVGIETNGVILSTRKHGRIYYDYPFTHYFNYVLIYAKVDGEYVLLDATNPYLSNWSIPDKCINGKALLIEKSKEEAKWVPLESNSQSETILKMDISFVEDEIVSKVKTIFSGKMAADKRQEVSEETFDPVKDLMESDGVVEESVEMLHLNDKESDFSIEFDYVKEFSLGSDKIYFSPFFEEMLIENPLKEKYREYPIDFTYSRKFCMVSTIEIPEGYQLDYYKNDFKNLDNDYFELIYNATEADGKLTIEFTYWFKKSVYPSTSYSRLKYYFDEIIKLGQEKVVFKKVE